MTKDSNHLKQIFDNVIAQVICAGLFALVGGVITFFATRPFCFTTLETCLLVILSVIIIIIVSYLIYRRRNRRLPLYAPIDCDFHMIREERVHKWINENDYVHIRRYKIRALKSNLEEYVDKFLWTGQQDYRLSPGEGEYSIEIDKQAMNVFTVYRFKFNTPLNEGDTIELEARWEAKGPAKPFFSTDIQEPTDELIMRVELFPGSGIKKVCCRIDRNIGAIPNNQQDKKNIKTEKLNSEGIYRWKVKNPKILHHYEINWEDKENKL